MKRACFIFWFGCIAGFWACSGGGKAPAEPQTPRTGIPVIDQLSERIEQQGATAELYHLRSKAYWENELFAQAVPDAEKALEMDSIQPEYYRQLANAYFDNNQSKPAIKTLEKAVERFPTEPLFYKMAIEMNLIVMRYNEALIMADNLLKVNPYDGDALFLRGQVLKYMGDTLQAMTYYQKAVEQDADHIDAYLQLGINSTALGQDIAVQYLKNALRIDSANITALMNLAWHYHLKKQYETARTWYEKAIETHPLEADPQYNLGQMYLQQAGEQKGGNKAEHYNRALQCFDLATKCDPTFGEAYYYRGFCHEQLGDKVKAFADYDQAMVFEKVIQGVPITEIREAMQRTRPR